MNSALLAFQSRLLAWSDKTTPPTGKPSGTLTSNGSPFSWFVRGTGSLIRISRCMRLGIEPGPFAGQPARGPNADSSRSRLRLPDRAHWPYLPRLFAQGRPGVGLTVKIALPDAPEQIIELWCCWTRWMVDRPAIEDGPPVGLEMSRPASRSLVSHKQSRPGWPGRLCRVVRRRRIPG